MAEQEYEVERILKGRQVYRVTGKSRADAIRNVMDGQGEAVSFEIISGARTAEAYPVDEFGGPDVEIRRQDA